MSIQRGDFIRSKSFWDVCVRVLDVLPGTPSSVELFVQYWNLGQGGGAFPIPVTQQLKIDKNDLINWEHVKIEEKK